MAKQLNTSHAIIVSFLIIAVLFSVLSILVAFSLADFKPVFKFGGANSEDASGNGASDVKIVINPPMEPAP